MMKTSLFCQLCLVLMNHLQQQDVCLTISLSAMPSIVNQQAVMVSHDNSFNTSHGLLQMGQLSHYAPVFLGHCCDQVHINSGGRWQVPRSALGHCLL